MAAAAPLGERSPPRLARRRSLPERRSQPAKTPATMQTRSRISKTRTSCMCAPFSCLFFPLARNADARRVPSDSLGKAALLAVFAHGRSAAAVSDAPITVAAGDCLSYARARDERVPVRGEARASHN